MTGFNNFFKKKQDAGDILPVVVLEFIPLLVFFVVFVSVFLVFVLVFMFIRVYDTKERSTCSAAWRKHKYKTNMFGSQMHFYFQLGSALNKLGRKVLYLPFFWNTHSNLCLTPFIMPNTFALADQLHATGSLLHSSEFTNSKCTHHSFNQRAIIHL